MSAAQPPWTARSALVLGLIAVGGVLNYADRQIIAVLNANAATAVGLVSRLPAKLSMGPRRIKPPSAPTRYSLVEAGPQGKHSSFSGTRAPGPARAPGWGSPT